MRLTHALETKVAAGIRELPITAAERDQLDYDIYSSIVKGTGDQVNTIYIVQLFLRLDAADQVGGLEQIDPYATQEEVSGLVVQLWDKVSDMRDSYVQAVAPGLIPPMARRSRQGLILPG